MKCTSRQVRYWRWRLLWVPALVLGCGPATSASALDPELRELLAAACDDHPRIRAARERHRARDFESEAVQSQRWSPDLTLSVQADMAQDERYPGSGGLVSTTEDDYGATLSSRVDLYDGGVNVLKVRLARAQGRRAALQVQSTTSSVVRQVLQAYAHLAARTRLLRLNAGLRDEQAALVQRMERLLAQGDAAITTADSARLGLLDLEARAVELRRQVDEAVETLEGTTGRSVDSEAVRALPQLGESALPDLEGEARLPQADGAFARIAAGNPEWQGALLDLKAARLRMGLADSAFRPTVSGGVSASYTHSDISGDIRSTNTQDEVAVNLVLTLPLYDNGVRRARSSGAAAELAAAREALDTRRRTLRTHLNNALIARRAAHTALEAAERRVDLAGRYYRNARRQLLSGTRSVFELNDALDRLQRARIERVESQLALFQARVDLLDLTGRLTAAVRPDREVKP